MDGNGRWARRKGFLRVKGHEEGVNSVREITTECAKKHIGQLTLYALSNLSDKNSINVNILTHLEKNRMASIMANPDNPKQDFNPDLALALLTEAGWTKKPGDKLLSKDGEFFEIENFYIYQGWDRIFNPLVKDLEEVGIKINLVVLQNTFEKLMDRKFKVQHAGWTGYLLPSPEGMLHSKFSEKLDVTNVTGMANKEIDELIEDYNSNWSMDERVKILQKIDGIAAKEYHWAFGWGAPYGYRCLNWDKFGMPKQGIEYKDPSTGEVLSILEELETPGTEYLNIQLHDDDGWKLDVYENGFVEFYNGYEPKRLIKKNVSHEEVIQMWRLLQDGERDRIKKMMRARAIKAEA